MTYEEARKAYLATVPGAKLENDEDNDRFNAWSGNIGLYENVDYGKYIENWANNTDDTRLDDPNFASGLGLTQISGPSNGASQPAQQVITNEVLDRAGVLMAGDAGRAQDASNILASYAPTLNATRELVASTQGSINGDLYMRENPDVAAAWQASGGGMSANDFAAQHWNTYGRAEGRATPYVPSGILSQQLGASSTAAKAQQASLSGQIASMQSNLAAEVAAKNSNLSAQLSSMQSNLSGELSQRASAIQQQIAALQNGIGVFSSAEIASLERQIATNFDNLAQEVATRKVSLQQALASMGQSVNEYDVARKAAVEQEISQLNEAQAPLNAARVQAAQTVAGAVNMAAQSQMDNIAADAALSGYIGSSTGEQMAVTRAAVDGRQKAAMVLGDANVANASDTATIGKYGANRRAGVADDTATLRKDLGFYGASETRNLEDYGANQKRLVGDAGAAGRRAIDNTTNTMQFDLTKFGAGEQRALSDYGSQQNRMLSDFGATQKREIADTGASQTRAIGDYGATETRGVADSQTMRDLGFFSNDVQQRLSNLTLPSVAINQEFSIRNAADNYANSGLAAGLNLLNGVRIDQSAAPSQMVSQVQPNTTMGSAYQNLGAGIADVGASMVERSFWKPSATTNVNSGVSSMTPNGYDAFTGFNYNSSPYGGG